MNGNSCGSVGPIDPEISVPVSQQIFFSLVSHTWDLSSALRLVCRAVPLVRLFSCCSCCRKAGHCWETRHWREEEHCLVTGGATVHRASNRIIMTHFIMQ
jgi:hypothetical protein